MQQYYSQITSLMLESGKMLLPKAGSSEDIGVKKSWLTQQDIEIEQKFIKLISSFGSEHVVFGEEINNSFIESPNIWVLDPISHTFAFIHGLPHYAVVVAHRQNNQTVFAAVYDPSVNEFFLAEKDKGTTLNGKKVSVNTTSKDLCFMYDPDMEASWISKEERLAVQASLMDYGRNKVFGSAALMHAYVACGRAHGAIDINKDPFTIFAGELLVLEAGGVVSDEKQQNINLDTQGVISSNGIIHNQLVDSWNKRK